MKGVKSCGKWRPFKSNADNNDDVDCLPLPFPVFPLAFPFARIVVKSFLIFDISNILCLPAVN